jgi:hypothetical protein
MDAIKINRLEIHNSPDVSGWPSTATITRVAFGDDGVNVDFTKEDSADRWPDVLVFGSDGFIEFTLWMAVYLGGVWHASGVIEYWHGRTGDGGNVAKDRQIATNWFYDSRWGPMSGYQPAEGELVGIFVTAGDARGRDAHIVAERSNIVVVPFPPIEGAVHTFGDVLPAPPPDPGPAPDPWDLDALIDLGADIAQAVASAQVDILELNQRLEALQALKDGARV